MKGRLLQCYLTSALHSAEGILLCVPPVNDAQLAGMRKTSFLVAAPPPALSVNLQVLVEDGVA